MNFYQWRKHQQLREDAKSIHKIVDKFIPFAKKHLKLKGHPEIHFLMDGSFAKKIAAFGEISKKNVIEIDIKERHPMDILRTLAHELVHYQQHEEKRNGTGHVGSKTENEANQVAGVLLRKFGEKHPDYFELSAIDEAKKKKRLDNRDYEHYPMEMV